MATAASQITLTREKLCWMYERMTLIREFEERLKWLVEIGRARRRSPLLHGPGSGCRRRLRRAESRRLHRLHAPGPWALHR